MEHLLYTREILYNINEINSNTRIEYYAIAIRNIKLNSNCISICKWNRRFVRSTLDSLATANLSAKTWSIFTSFRFLPKAYIFSVWYPKTKQSDLWTKMDYFLIRHFQTLFLANILNDFGRFSWTDQKLFGTSSCV